METRIYLQTAAAAVTDTAQFPLEDSANANLTRKATGSQLITYANANVQLPSTGKVTGLDAALAGKQPSNSFLTSLAAQTEAPGNITLDGVFNGALGNTIASASNIDLDAATGNFLTVSGTVTINSITLSPGHIREIRFSGILTLVNGTIILPFAGQNIVTAPNDTATFYGTTGGSVICTNYQRADGTALAGDGAGTVTSVSVTPNNGITATINNPTTTPEIVLGLGLIEILSSEITANGGGYRGPQGEGDIHNFQVFDVPNTRYRSFIDVTAGTIPTVEFKAPLNGVVSFSDLSYVTQLKRSLNSGTSLTIDPLVSETEIITLTTATPTITLSNGPANRSMLKYWEIVQDGTGGRVPTFANVTFAAGSSPFIYPAIEAITYLSLKWNGTVWTMFAMANNLSSVITANTPVGSAVALTSLQYETIASVTLEAGTWDLYGAIGFTTQGLGATGDFVIGFWGTANGDDSAGIDFSANTISSPTMPAISGDVIVSMPTYRVVPAVTTTYYLKAYSSFTVGSVYSYGSINARDN